MTHASYRTHSSVKNSYFIDVSRDINSKIYESVILRETYFSIGKLPTLGRVGNYVDRPRVNRVRRRRQQLNVPSLVHCCI